MFYDCKMFIFFNFNTHNIIKVCFMVVKGLNKFYPGNTSNISDMKSMFKNTSHPNKLDIMNMCYCCIS